VRGVRNAGIIFFEDTNFDASARERARSLDIIIAGSTWNAEVLRAAGFANVRCVQQGIDPTIFHPAPRSGLLADRFVVFSGGKLEYRKGQDLVVAAFRRFRERHPEALLVTAWHNAWPQLISDLDLAGHVSGTPRFNSEGLLVTEWLDANGLPPEAVLDIGRTPNALMGAVVREADVALFPNRCEGGTNLVAMECIAAGVPTIVSANTGHLDLVATGGCIAVTRQAPVRPPTRFYKATEGWGESSIDEIVDALEKVYSGRQAASDAAIRGAAVMKDWTWPRQIDRLMQVLAPLAG
jgi:glycosyltransferase involved in cell wall biosynthesis